VLFDGYGTGNNWYLWVTNGTAAGTYALGLPWYPYSSGGDLTPFGNELVFVANTLSGGRSRDLDLIITNLTAAGTYNLTSNYPGGYPSGVDASDPTVFDGEVLFSGVVTGQVSGQGLWVTNGTVAGTGPLTGVIGAAPDGLQPADLTVFNGEVIFQGIDTAGTAGLWVTNGTAAGTYELTGISGIYTSAEGLLPTDLTVFNGEVLFAGVDSAGKVGLWVTNGTAAGTFEVTGISGAYASFGVQPADLTVFNGEVLFDGTDAANTRGLWVTNGTAAGTFELTGISGVNSTYGLAPIDLTVYNGEVLFQGYDTAGKSGLWVTDGTAAGTHELNGISGSNTGANGLSPTNLTTLTLPSIASDFTGNGTSDVLWYNATTGDVGDWLMMSGAPQWQYLSGSQSPWQVQGVGDFNGDGTSDVLWRNSSTGQVLDWVITNNLPQQQILGPSSTSFQIAGVGDFNGDGTDDILWQNPANNDVGIWQMQNNTPTWEGIGYGSTTMNIAGVGDFTGTGKDDILWRTLTTASSACGRSAVQPRPGVRSVRARRR
jgi:ELWxxDGT repeat protein